MPANRTPGWVVRCDHPIRVPQATALPGMNPERCTNTLLLPDATGREDALKRAHNKGWGIRSHQHTLCPEHAGKTRNR